MLECVDYKVNTYDNSEIDKEIPNFSTPFRRICTRVYRSTDSLRNGLARAPQQHWQSLVPLLFVTSLAHGLRHCMEGGAQPET